LVATHDSVTLSEDERTLQETVRGFLDTQLSSAQLRSALDADPGYNPELYTRLTGELGLAGLTIPEQFGGLGKSQAEACVVHTELGRALYPGPFLPTCLAAAVLLAAGDRDAREHWLPLLAKGSAAGTVAAADEAGQWSPGPDSVRAERILGGWRLSGRRWFVIAAHVADIVLVPALTESGLAMFLVEPGSPRFTLSRQLSLDLTRRISITGFDATPALLLSRDASALASLARAEHEFLLATAAEAAGGISWCLDASIAYAKDREQFARPVGSFQAMAQFCVDMLADLQSVSAVVRHAAVATAEGATDARQAARAAALQAGESYRAATEAATHLFAGIGNTWEHDAHLYYRRAWSTQRPTRVPYGSDYTALLPPGAESGSA
jgi:alkylation response protein AidB-like acyl-CoA dehydrogenase